MEVHFTNTEGKGPYIGTLKRSFCNATLVFIGMGTPGGKYEIFSDNAGF
jgi:hypothetical protein